RFERPVRAIQMPARRVSVWRLIERLVVPDANSFYTSQLADDRSERAAEHQLCHPRVRVCQTQALCEDATIVIVPRGRGRIVQALLNGFVGHAAPVRKFTVIEEVLHDEETLVTVLLNL